MFGHLYLCGKCDRWHTNLAGGVILSSEGLVLTNYHVMNFPEARLFGAMTREGTTYLVESVVASSKENDLALVQLAEAIDLPTVSLADSASIGDQVTVISHPDSHFFLQTTGEIARFNLSQPHKYRRMQITADFARGSSGCGVFDSDGKLVGLVTATNSVYYTQEEEIQKDLQMVVKTCIPLESIEELLSTE
ncbi:MAG: serine protease [Verrucomicrobiota bacterium]